MFSSLFRDLTKRCFPTAPANAIRCYELMCVHVGLVPVQFAVKHIRRLASKLFETSLGAHYPISLIQWRQAGKVNQLLPFSCELKKACSQAERGRGWKKKWGFQKEAKRVWIQEVEINQIVSHMYKSKSWALRKSWLDYFYIRNFVWKNKWGMQT